MVELDLAKEFLYDSKLCLDNKRLRSAVSRAYYAVFHACVALFKHYGYDPSNFIGRGGIPAKVWEHGIIIKYFHIEFIYKRKIFEWYWGAGIKRLYRSRIAADYRTDMIIAKALAEESYKDADSLIAMIERMVN